MPMLGLIAMAAAGAVALPEPRNDRDRWLRDRDIPESQFNAGRDGYFYYQALVGPDGKVDSCKVLNSSAPEADWPAFCKAIKRSFSFAGATGPSGAQAYYLLDENAAFVLPSAWGLNALPRQPQLVIEAKGLSGTKDGKLQVAVNVAVDASGKLQQCDVPAGAAHEALARLACKQLQSDWQPLPAENSAGKPVAYVRELRIDFRTPAAGG